jgi:hypothetical protein
MNDATNKLQKALVEHLQEALPDVSVYTATGEPTNERDTHFAGFAKLLETELSHSLDVWFDSPAATQEQIRTATRLRIAQRAYDLKQHIMRHIDDHELQASRIPDMTAWPEPGTEEEQDVF